MVTFSDLAKQFFVLVGKGREWSFRSRREYGALVLDVHF